MVITLGAICAHSELLLQPKEIIADSGHYCSGFSFCQNAILSCPTLCHLLPSSLKQPCGTSIVVMQSQSGHHKALQGRVMTYNQSPQQAELEGFWQPIGSHLLTRCYCAGRVNIMAFAAWLVAIALVLVSVSRTIAQDGCTVTVRLPSTGGGQASINMVRSSSCLRYRTCVGQQILLLHLRRSHLSAVQQPIAAFPASEDVLCSEAKQQGDAPCLCAIVCS